MTRRKETALAHPVAPNYSGAVATPPRMSWKETCTYTCPELQHRSRGQSIHSIVLGKRVETAR